MTLFRCSMSGENPDGRPWSCSVGVVSSSSASAVETDWSAQVVSMWTNGSHGIETLFPTATTLTETKTEQLQVVTIGTVDKLRAQQVARTTQTLAGTSANPSLPEQNVILVTLRTANPGREGSGRFHLPSPDATLVTTGQLGTVPATRVSTSIEALRTGMAGAAHPLNKLTAVKTKIGTPVGTTVAITMVETDEIIRTLRIRNKSRAAVRV